MKRLLVLFALLFILTVSPSAESGAVTLEPVRITVTTSTPNTTPGATLTIDLLNSNGSDLSPAVQISRTGIKTNLGGVLSFVLDEPDWSAPVYDADYLVRVTYGGVVLSIERLEVVYAKQGLYGTYLDNDEMDLEGTVTVTSTAAEKLTPGNTINGVNFDGSAPITIPADGTTLTGTVAPNHGGTGLYSYTRGDIIYASDVTTLSNLNDAATGNALISGGVGTAPSWGKIDLTSHTEGILPVANGGTGQNSYTDGQILIGNSSGNGLSKTTLTAGSGIAITNGNGSITISAPSSGIFIPSNFSKNTVTITSSSTTAFTVPAGVYIITIEAAGGSGGGGGSGADRNATNTGASGGGGGGGAGEYVGIILNVKPGDVIGVARGSAGTAGTAGPNSGLGDGGNGGNGGNTIITLNPSTDNVIVLAANGGMGGAGSPGNATLSSSLGGAGGNGGTGSTDQQHKNGITGSSGTATPDYATAGGAGGVGGASPNPTETTTNKGGNGGAGVYNGSNTKVGNPGNAGASGCVVITYY